MGIIIDNIRNISNNSDYENIIIVRSLKHAINGASHQPILSPSVSLLCDYQKWAKQGNWNAEKFASDYVPRFIHEIKHNPNAIALLDELYKRSKSDDIALYCFCQDETLCHRSIVAGMLLGAGANISCSEDYRKYWQIFKEA